MSEGEGRFVIVQNEGVDNECIESVEHVYLIDGHNIQLLPSNQESIINKGNEITFQNETRLILPSPTPQQTLIKGFSCEKCDFKTHARANLRKHIKFKHSGLRFQCSDCEYSSPQKGDVRRHHQAKHSDVKYSCDNCTYIANSTSLLKEHKRMKHSGRIELYICDICNFSSAYRSALNKHIKLHSNLVYNCPECTFQTRRKDALELHVKGIHRKERLKCSECDYDCANKTALNNHIKAKHQGIRFSCDICNLQFTRKWNLILHMEKIHSEFVEQESGTGNIQRSFSPYLVFYKEKYKEVSFEHPYLTASEKKQYIRKLWIKMSLQEKDKYKPKYYLQPSAGSEITDRQRTIEETEDEPDPEPKENQQSMTSSNQQPIEIEQPECMQHKFPPNFSMENEEQSYVLLQTESGEIVQLVGDKHVIAEHFKPQCNIGTDLPRVLQDTSIIRTSIISSKEQLPIAKNVLTPLTSNDITLVTSNKEQVENSSIPGSSVITRQEQLVISNIPGDSPADKFTTQEEQPRNEPEDESSLPGSSKQQMGRNYSCDECDYVAKLLHHLRSHKTSKHSAEWIKCPYCLYKAKRKDMLKRHLISEHQNIRHECEQCDYVTADISSLKKHRESMHEGKMQSCRFCGELFKHKSTRMAHINREHKQQLENYLEKPRLEPEAMPIKTKETKRKSLKPDPKKSANKPKLKRPPTKYILFCENEQKKIMEEKPKISFPDLGKELSRRWKETSPGIKQEYELKYKRLLSQYNTNKKQMQQVKNARTTKIVPEITCDNIVNSTNDVSNSHDDDVKQLELLKPLSAFFFFMKQERIKLRKEFPGISAREQVNRIKDRWRNLTAEEKEKYRKESRLEGRKQMIEAANIQRKEQGLDQIQIVSIELLDNYLQTASVEDLTNMGIKLNSATQQSDQT